MIKIKLSIDDAQVFKGKFNNAEDLDKSLKALKLKLK